MLACSLLQACGGQGGPTQGTALGGGIGFHGWIDDWDLEGPRRLSWGCVVMRNADIRQLFDRVPIGAMVVIF
jgi:lipoprotein-anchoring transpeptidase ErfK/SrfK